MARWSESRSWLTWFAIFFVLLAAAGVLVAAFAILTRPDVADLTSMDAPTLRAALGTLDSGSYLRIAMDLRAGSIPPADAWILNLWPPGVPAVDYVLLALPGLMLYKVLAVVIVVWSLAGATVAGVIASRGRVVLAGVFAAAWVFTPSTFNWVLGPGALYSEGFGTSFLILAVVAIAFLERRVRQRGASWGAVGAGAGAGGLLALALHFRWPLFISCAVVIASSIVCVVVLLIARAARRSTSRYQGLVGPLSALVATFVLCVAPWTIYGATHLHPGTVSWSMTDYLWAETWMTDAELRETGNGWLQELGGNWACNIDPDGCRTQHVVAMRQSPEDFPALRTAAMKAAVTHPVAFVQDRAHYWGHSWFGSPMSDVPPIVAVPFGLLQLGAFVGLVVVAIRNRRRAPVLIVAIGGLLLGQFVLLALSHIEPRYWIPVFALNWAGIGLIASATPKERPRPAGSAGLEELDDAGHVVV